MQPRKVLVVDDSKMMHKMYEVMLRQHPLIFAGMVEWHLNLRESPGYRSRPARSQYPSMGALEFLEETGIREQAARLQIIIVSTEGDDADVARGLELGARDVIKKPFHAEELIDKIANLG